MLWETYKNRRPEYTDQDQPFFLYEFINWCFNNPENPALKFISMNSDKIKTYFGAGGKYLSHQCKFMGPIEDGIRITFGEIIESLEIPSDKESQVKLMIDLVRHSINIYHRYWHNYMLAYTRMALIMCETRAEYFAGNMSKEEAIEHLIEYGVTIEEATALLKKEYKPTKNRFTFPSQKDMLNY